MSVTPEQAREALARLKRGFGLGSKDILMLESFLAALHPPSPASEVAGEATLERFEQAITHICNWFTYQNDHWKGVLGDLIRANVGPLLMGFPVAAAQPKAPSLSERRPLCGAPDTLHTCQPAPSPTPGEVEDALDRIFTYHTYVEDDCQEDCQFAKEVATLRAAFSRGGGQLADCELLAQQSIGRCVCRDLREVFDPPPAAETREGW